MASGNDAMMGNWLQQHKGVQTRDDYCTEELMMADG
jgi:hypothetical protein